MNIQRPNLEKLDPEVRAYIESLEGELERLRKGTSRQRSAEPIEPDEPPTTINVISISTTGLAKRTPRHLYSRQRRGGMGVFDLETPESDPPALLAIADESQYLVLVTDQARAFRLPVRAIHETPVRGRGKSLVERLSLLPGERVTLVLPDQGGAYVTMLTQRGHVKWFAGHLFGERMGPGTIFYEPDKFGPPAAACWTSGDSDLFIATREGRAIRFSARQIPARGCLGIRLDRDDIAAAITAVRLESGVFLLSADGKGTIRLLSGFRANKAPGAGGKIAIKTDQLVGAVAAETGDDLFIISRLGKIIRFRADEVPGKEGTVQGVHCISLRADEATAVAVSPGSSGVAS